MRIGLRQALLPHLDEDASVAADAVYGSVLLTAVIAAAAVHDESPVNVLVLAGASIVVFWAAHIYAGVLAEWGVSELFSREALRTVMAHEIGMLEAAIVPLGLLAAGALGLLDDDTSVQLAMWSGVVVLVLVGTVAMRRRGQGWGSSLGAGLVAGTFGATLILLKAWLH